MKKSSIIEKIKEPQILLSILYIIAVAIGMLFNYNKYILYGINIFDYADLTDFLLAPFGDLNIILTSLLAIVTCLAFYWIDSFIKKSNPKFYDFKIFKIISYTYLSTFISFILFIIMINIMANKYGANQFKILSNSQPITIKTNENTFQAKYLGKTKDVLFVIDENLVKIIPITSNIEYYTVN